LAIPIATRINMQHADQNPPLPFLSSADKVISMHEAAAMSGVSASTLKRRARAGELKVLKLSPRRVGIRLSDFHRWLDACAA
jgi:predicted DNA-binding transcriptional regulator AlpA